MEVLIISIAASVITLAITLWINYLISKEFYKAACDKGYTKKKYLWLPFWLGIVGYALVIALPDRSSASNTGADDLPEL